MKANFDFRARPVRFDMALQLILAGAPMYRKAWGQKDGVQPHVYYVEHYGKDNKAELLLKPHAGGAFPFMADPADLLAKDWVAMDLPELQFLEILMRLLANSMKDEERMRADQARARERGV